MKLTLLGTGGADGMPALFCLCKTCQRARTTGGRDFRARASALINDDLKIDLPPDTSHHSLTAGLQMGRVKTLLFTHGHDDHFCPSELQYLGRHFVAPPAQPLRVLAPADIIERLDELYGEKDLPLCLQMLSAEETVKVAGYRLTPVLANHVQDIECFNHLITEDKTGKTLLYATDTGWWSEKTWNFLATRTADAVVLECGTGPVPDGYAGHLNVAQVIATREKLVAQGTIQPNTPVVITHFSHHGDYLHSDYEKVFAPHGIVTGFDGYTLELP